MTTQTDSIDTNESNGTAASLKAKIGETGETVRKAANDVASKSRDAAKKAAKRIDEATETTVDSAKRHPATAAAIAVGAAAAVAGAAFGVSKLVEKRKAAPKPKKAAAEKPEAPKPPKAPAAPRRRQPAGKANATTH
jgi:hypothetical protein